MGAMRMNVSSIQAPLRIRGANGKRCGYAAILAHAGGVLYGTEFGSVT